MVPEDPILIPEDEVEFYEAVDPMPESAVPDLEETGECKRSLSVVANIFDNSS